MVQNEAQVKKLLENCGLVQYYDIFIEEGFDRLDSLFEITETDLIQMQVKRGHRRLLQRAISNAQGIPSTAPLYMLNDTLPPIQTKTTTTTMPSFPSSSSNSSSFQIQQQPFTTTPLDNNTAPSAGTMVHSSHTGMSSTEEEPVTSDNVHRLWKRKYQRHPKPDTNAPLKPASAYIMFSNDVRSELKQQNKSFTDLAKIIGDRWKNISTAEKDRYELNAQKAREAYLKKVEEYQKTEKYREYQKYLSDFKAENEAAARPVGRPRKRHKRDDEEPRRSSDSNQYPFYLLNQKDTNNNNNNS